MKEAGGPCTRDFGEVDRRCVDGVPRQIRNRTPEHGTALVPTTLVPRASTATPPRASR